MVIPEHNVKKCDMNRPFAFISYSSADKEIVSSDVATLRDMGVNIWIDEEMRVGREWQDEAFNAMEDPNCKLVIFYISEASLTSENVLEELEHSQHNPDVLLFNEDQPLMLHPIQLESLAGYKNLTTWLSKYLALKYSKTREDKALAKYANKIIKTFLSEGKITIQGGAGPHDDTYFSTILRSMSENGIMTNQADGHMPAAEAVHEEPAPIEPESIAEPAPDTAAEPSEPVREEISQDAQPLPESSAHKKPYTVTGDITFSIYGQEHTENQSGMMLTVFQEVLRRHQDAVDELIDRLNCASDVDYEDNKNRGDAMPSYFRVCKTFRLTSVGKQICIGTAYGYTDKLKLIAKLFAITGEDPAVLEGVELPSVRVRAPGGAQAEEGGARPGARGDELTYHVYHYDGVGNQSELMYDVYSEVLKRHPDKLDEAVDRLTSLSLTDYTLPENRGDGMPTYFRNSKSYVVDGRTFCVGASYGIKDKLIQIAKLLTICGEPADILTIDGMEFPPASGKPGRRGGRTSSGPTEL